MTRPAESLLAIFLSIATVQSTPPPRGQKWIAPWAARVHGPDPWGNPVAQPVLDKVFAPPEGGARDQTFRLILEPGVWGTQARLRFSNVFGPRPGTLDEVFAGVQASGASVAPGSNRRVTFNGGKPAVTLPPGQSTFSDTVALPFFTRASAASLRGGKSALT